MNERTHLDLFSGIGGFALAAQWNGVRTVGFCECGPYAQQILREKFGAMADADGGRCGQCDEEKRVHEKSYPILHGDVRRLDGTAYRGVWLLTGGFPCQPYSVAGKRRGAGDDRALWPEMRRVIAEARPAWVLGENVPGIVNMELDRCLSDLENLGYTCRAFSVPACAVDAKHRRERIWIAANAGIGKYPRSREHVHAVHSEEEGNWKKTQPLNGRGPEIWQPEPELGRVAHGIPNRSHRLRGLGNAIVPQVAAEFIRMMIKSEDQND